MKALRAMPPSIVDSSDLYGERIEIGDEFTVSEERAGQLEDAGYAEITGTSPDEEPPEDGPLAGVDFTSDSAEQAAREAELTADDFEDGGGSGSEGAYTVKDVQSLASS